MWKIHKDYVLDNKIHIIDGLQKIDYMRTLDIKKEINKIYKHVCPDTGILTNKENNKIFAKKSILFVQNTNIHSDNAKDYKKTLIALKTYAIEKNCHVFIKIKHISKIPKECIIKNKNFTYVSKAYNFMLYPLLGCDAIIIQNYGTSYCESLMVNPRTLVYQYTGDILNIKKYDSLPQAYNNKDMIKWLDCFLFSDKYPLENFESQKDSYLKENVGENYKTSNTTQEIVNILHKSQ